MWWELALVALVVFTAAAVAARHVYRMLVARGVCACAMPCGPLRPGRRTTSHATR